MVESGLWGENEQEIHYSKKIDLPFMFQLYIQLRLKMMTLTEVSEVLVCSLRAGS